MFKSDFDYRQRKFEKESKARAQIEKRKRELALRTEARIKKQQEEAEVKRQQKFLEQQRLKEEEESRKEQLRQLNRGVFFEDILSPNILPDETAISLGIKRWIDKVRLPASVQSVLMDQGASKNGAMLFELTAENGKRTHVGILDFTAMEGTISIPSHVARCLWDSGSCEGKISVRYKRLLDGKSARFQPLRRGFHEAIGDDLRMILEERLSQQSTLTEGDLIQVYVQNTDQLYDLKVIELEPSLAISILDTDLEVDVIPSEEVESLLKEQLKSNQLQPSSSSKFTVQPQDQIADQAEQEQFVSAVRVENLPEEVPETEENIIACSIRLPDGINLRRRFRLDDALSNLFTYIRAKASDQVVSNCCLVTRFPHHQISESVDSVRTFRDYGFDQQQMFFLQT